MRIVLIKDHAVALRVLPEGTELRVSNKLGAELIELQVAKEFGDYTTEEKVEHILEVAFDNEEKPKVKKITKVKK
jgi:hypothetical protein